MERGQESTQVKGTFVVDTGMLWAEQKAVPTVF